ncbi:MAG TPA: M28 family peptidase, partial [Thermoleophilia bacterium]|nr:M28 family peptidase [Thermoleophilia bacterium]
MGNDVDQERDAALTMRDRPSSGRPSLVDILSDIGPRTAGSPQARRASRRIADAMAALGMEVEFQEFEFLGYEPGEPSLTVGGERWTAAPCLYARAAEVEGTLRALGRFTDVAAEVPVFAIVDGDTEVGRLYAAPFDAGAVPLGNVLGPTMAGVSAIVSSADGRRLAALEGAEVALTTRGRLVEGARDRNVLGYLPGQKDEWVVVSSHFDSVWRGPGVLDNATGVEGMVRVIERLPAERRSRGVIACAFAAEEIGLLGSRYFAADANLSGRISSIVGAVNLDAIAHGEHFEVSVAP